MGQVAARKHLQIPTVSNTLPDFYRSLI
jgi:TRAP-type mannitol/chloroaromatic compound transport system substrate-binding protein